MKLLANGDMCIPVAGHTNTTLLALPGIHSCGTIRNGVALAHLGDGVWVIRFTDLEKFYLAVKAKRQR